VREMPNKKVAIAMSGGVDSSLAAALLKDAGYEVFGIHLKLWADPAYRDNLSRLEQVCRSLDIPLHELNLESEFHNLIVSYFCREYSQGRTPNPCPLCNKRIKFGRLLNRALEMGADFLASGHYARVEGSIEGYRLLKAAEATKDQSYFLYTLEQTELPQLLFPLGSRKKTEVRKLAEERGLSTASQGESHDLCFIPDGDYRAFLARYLPTEPGDITDIEGKILGKHRGLAHYTVGQRQGLGLSSAGRRYVLRLDPPKNRLVVGSESQLLSQHLIARKLSWVAGRPPENLAGITARIRYRSPEALIVLSLNGETAEVEFYEPQRAMAPGQAIVFYQGDTVLGGGIIEGSLT
jgi:tRNA-specific 2-thiouridylase